MNSIACVALKSDAGAADDPVGYRFLHNARPMVAFAGAGLPLSGT
jgi:hypothetical protein